LIVTHFPDFWNHCRGQSNAGPGPETLPSRPNIPYNGGMAKTNIEPENKNIGKKIFFLHPTAVVQNRIVSDLIQHEYEVYVAKNKDSLRHVLKKNPDAVVFVDINEHMTGKEWEAWITSIKKTPETANVSIGIVTANEDAATKEKYLEKIKAFAYIIIKFDLDKTTGKILEALQTVSAKDRRKFLRANLSKETNATINLPMNGSFLNGQIKAISVAGISFILEGSHKIPINTKFKDIQIRLQSTLLKAEGIIFGTCSESKENVYVILFTQRIDPDVRTRIRKYIQQFLQGKMENDLK
jgi:CheY-like chemotaxis protein